MSERKPWREMTEADIYEIRRQKCVRCPYSYAGQNNENGERTPYDCYCAYIVHTGHRRGVRPEDCQHYLDKGVRTTWATEEVAGWDSLSDIRKGRGDSFQIRGVS